MNAYRHHSQTIETNVKTCVIINAYRITAQLNELSNDLQMFTFNLKNKEFHFIQNWKHSLIFVTTSTFKRKINIHFSTVLYFIH